MGSIRRRFDRPEVNVDAGAFLTYFGKRGSVTLGSFLILLSIVSFLWLVVLRTGALPRWLGWLRLALGALAADPSPGPAPPRTPPDGPP